MSANPGAQVVDLAAFRRQRQDRRAAETLPGSEAFDGLPFREQIRSIIAHATS